MSKYTDMILDNDEGFFYKSLACALGVGPSCILKQIGYWCTINKNRKRREVYRESKWWMYASAADMQTNDFPWMGKSTIEKHIKDLIDLKLLDVGVYNAYAYDRTQWYSPNTENFEMFMELWVKHGKPGRLGGRKSQNEAYKNFMAAWEAMCKSLPHIDDRSRSSDAPAEPHATTDTEIHKSEGTLALTPEPAPTRVNAALLAMLLKSPLPAVSYVHMPDPAAQKIIVFPAAPDNAEPDDADQAQSEEKPPASEVAEEVGAKEEKEESVPKKHTSDEWKLAVAAAMGWRDPDGKPDTSHKQLQIYLSMFTGRSKRFKKHNMEGFDSPASILAFWGYYRQWRKKNGGADVDKLPSSHETLWLRSLDFNSLSAENRAGWQGYGEKALRKIKGEKPDERSAKLEEREQYIEAFVAINMSADDIEASLEPLGLSHDHLGLARYHGIKKKG